MILFKARSGIPLLAFIPALLASACAEHEDGHFPLHVEHLKVKTRYSWTPDAHAMARLRWNGVWEFFELNPGTSTVVHLYRHEFRTTSSDGQFYYEITLQIPSDVEAGQTIDLRTVPADRPPTIVNEHNRLTSMSDGEITAFKYANPNMGWMRHAEIASVTILSIEDSQAVVRLRLKADHDRHPEFDMDEEFTLSITSPPHASER